MGKTIAILQPNYIPWLGYFDLIGQVDEFIIYDDTQYTRRDWRNRNRINVGGRAKWLTIPVEVSGKYDQLIRDVRISDQRWQRQHFNALRHAYAQAPRFKEVSDLLASGYGAAPYSWLIDADLAFLEIVMPYLGLTTPIALASSYRAHGSKTERLVSLCQAAGANSYVSGPAARAYIAAEDFSAAGIGLRYIDYPAYPEFPHVAGYLPQMSVLDALFHCGDAVASHLPSQRKAAA